MTKQGRQVGELVLAARDLLRGKDPIVQGAVLADLLALWLAGHVDIDDPQATEGIREKILELHIETVRALIPINYANLIEPQLKARRLN